MRKSKSLRRLPTPDPKFGDTVASQFINAMMWSGKKSISQSIFYDALATVEEKTGTSGLDIFRKAINNASPTVEVRSRRVGGATYQVPTEVRPSRRQALAFRWLLTNARARNEKSMALRLASELIAASNNEGNTIKKKDDVHRMAEANKAFAHFRW